jgi:hypothetical protein
MESEKLEYWTAEIGPVDRNKLPLGADMLLREPLKVAFFNMCKQLDIPTTDYICSSGWGCDSEQLQTMFYARSTDETRKSLISSYHNENISMPRSLRAWELLYEEEQNLIK